jgi:hypothetical protein
MAPAVIVSSAGGAARQAVTAAGQRGAKEHPVSAAADATEPLISERRWLV